MQKVARNLVFLYEAKLKLEQEQLTEDAEIEQGTPLYKKNARLKQGNFSGLKNKQKQPANQTASTAVNSSINNEVEDLDKLEE